MKINHIITEFVTPQATAQDPGLEREKDVDVIFFGRMPQDFTARTAWKALEDVLPREYPAGSERAQNKIAEVSKNNGAVVTTKPLSIAQKLVKEFQARGIKCRIDASGLEEDLTRRGFLQGAGAAAVAGTAGSAKAQTVKFDVAARIAVQKAQGAIGKFFTVKFGGEQSRIMDYIAQNVNKAVLAYCMDTNGYNVLEVIDYATDSAYRAADAVPPSITDRGGAKTAISIANTFMDAYTAAILQKLNEYIRVGRSQQQPQQQPQQSEKAKYTGDNKTESQIPARVIATYVLSSDPSNAIPPEIAQLAREELQNFIKIYNAKEWVNANVNNLKKIFLTDYKNNEPEKYKQTVNGYKQFANQNIDALKKLNSTPADNDLTFKESVNHDMVEAARPPVAPDPQNYDSDVDYYNDRDADPIPQDTDADYENMDETKEKIGNMDADAFDDAISRLKKLAGAGPLRTVYDPARRVYKNVPHAVQPAQQPKKVR